MTAFAALAIVCTSSARAAEGWTEDLQAAIAEAKKTGKVIVADFTGSDWCGFCKKQHAEVFDTDTFKAWAKDNAVLLTVDFPARKRQDAATKKQNAELKAKFGVRGYPTIIFMTTKGDELGRFVGYPPGSGPEAWIKKANDIVSKNEKSGS